MRRQSLPSLFRSFNDWDNEMGRWMQRATNWPSTDFEQELDFSPSCNLEETPTEFIATMDIPGVQKDDVKIEVEKNRLTVSGERKSRREAKGDEAKAHLSETYYGSFMRSFTLPAAIDEAQVDAEYGDGVLTIRMPKTQKSKTTEVRVRSSQEVRTH